MKNYIIKLSNGSSVCITANELNQVSLFKLQCDSNAIVFDCIIAGIECVGDCESAGEQKCCGSEPCEEEKKTAGTKRSFSYKRISNLILNPCTRECVMDRLYISLLENNNYEDAAIISYMKSDKRFFNSEEVMKVLLSDCGDEDCVAELVKIYKKSFVPIDEFWNAFFRLR